MKYPPDKFLIAVVVRKTRADPYWRDLGYLVVDGLHSPFKPRTNFRVVGKCWKFPVYRSVVCALRPIKAASEYFDFLEPLLPQRTQRLRGEL